MLGAPQESDCLKVRSQTWTESAMRLAAVILSNFEYCIVYLGRESLLLLLSILELDEQVDIETKRLKSQTFDHLDRCIIFALSFSRSTNILTLNLDCLTYCTSASSLVPSAPPNSTISNTIS